MSRSHAQQPVMDEGPLPLATPERPTKICYVGAPAIFALDLACKPINQAFGNYGCYGVGSAWERPDWRDVDVRFVMADDDFYRLFPDVDPSNPAAVWEGDERWLLLTVALSDYLRKVTGLPVDFQFQPTSFVKRRHDKPRHPLGIDYAFAKKDT